MCNKITIARGFRRIEGNFMKWSDATCLIFILICPTQARADDYAYLADEYHKAMEQKCAPVVVKRPEVAAILGLLPGGGLFYTGDNSRAVRDMLLWPFGSFLWDPIFAYRSAKMLNMRATVEMCRAADHENLGKIVHELPATR